jgi:hypothetical protein
MEKRTRDCSKSKVGITRKVLKKCCLILRVLEKGFSGDMRNERELYVP